MKFKSIFANIFNCAFSLNYILVILGGCITSGTFAILATHMDNGERFRMSVCQGSQACADTLWGFCLAYLVLLLLYFGVFRPIDKILKARMDQRRTDEQNTNDKYHEAINPV